jgi:peroxiredoxin
MVQMYIMLVSEKIKGNKMIKQRKRKLIARALVICGVITVCFVGCKKKQDSESTSIPVTHKHSEKPVSPALENPVSDKGQDALENPVVISPADQATTSQVGGNEDKVSEIPKKSLYEIATSARNWGPSYQSWYGKPTPDFTLTDIKGKEHKLSDYRGKDVLLVFWATWCGPCKIEIPHLIALQNIIERDSLGWVILAISNESQDKVKPFVAASRMNYPVLLDKGQLPEPYRSVRSIPSSFFIDKQGKIKIGTVGPLHLGDIQAIFHADPL